jgi:hypothetical protein
LCLEHASITTPFFSLSLSPLFSGVVGDFRQLILWAEERPARVAALKRALKLNRTWDEVRDHALKAVQTDNNLRVWIDQEAMSAGNKGKDGPVGLLFDCTAAVPKLEAPIGEMDWNLQA